MINKSLNKKINAFFKNNILAMILLSLLLNISAIVLTKLNINVVMANIFFLLSLLFTGLPIFYKAFQSLTYKVISIELLVTIAVIGAIVIKEYSEAGIVCLLFQFGNYLELKTMQKTRSAIKDLVKNAPKVALKFNDGKEEEIDVDEVEIDDVLALHASRAVPVDGYVMKGDGYFIEASITGESKPVYKTVNDYLYAGSIVDNGDLLMKASKLSDDSTYQKIISLVEEASDNKSKMEKSIDKFAKYYTPFVIILAIAVLIIKYLLSNTWDIDTSITVLVLACPGALVIGVPVASVAGIGKASRNHILLKGGDNITNFAKSDVFIFDKTGTLTKGNTVVLNAYELNTNEDDLKVIYSMEHNSYHPLAKAITKYYDFNPLDIKTETIKGRGLKYNNYLIGNLALMKDNNVNVDEYNDLINKILNNGSSIILVSKDLELIAIYEIVDEIKDDAKQMVDCLKNKRVILLSGDNELVCKNVCENIGIKEYYSQLLPEDKMNIIKKLKENHVVTFVGDGINDTPSLALADVGISMGKASDVAIETSDIVLIKDKMMDLIKAYNIARKTIRISYENIFIALLTVVLLLLGLFLNYIHMALGMLIHELSILVVILNAMRLLIDRKETNEKD